jgi:LppP/LprE lipoprotein
MPELATPQGTKPPRPPRARRPPLRARPRPRAPRGRARTAIERILGVLGTAAVLGVGIAVALLVTDKRDDSPADLGAAPAAGTKPAATPAPATKPRTELTQAQRASRRAAVAQMRKQGFVPVSVAAYRPRQNLRVLIGKPTKASGVNGRRAFFFEREEYLGTDAETASSRVKVASQNKSGITLAYTLFAPADRACCPKGGIALVRFTMQDGRLQPSTPIPSAAVRLRNDS